MDQKQVWEQIKDNVDRVSTLKELNNILDGMHSSDAYVVIRDMFTPKTNRIIQMGKTQDVEEYQKFQDIKANAKQSWTHDHTNAMMIDVDKAVSKAYGIVIRMLREIMNQNERRFNKIKQAINKIEEHLEIDVTKFGEDDIDDTTESINVQGVEEDTIRTGETSTEV